MEYYWKDLTTPDKLLLTIFGPRMKDLSFISYSERTAARDLLREKYEELKQNNPSSSINIDNKKFDKQSKKEFTIFANLKKKITPANDEVGTYLQLEEIDLEANPFS
jgi:hypothetical protein